MLEPELEAPTIRWIGPTETREFAGCYELATQMSIEVEAEADLTVLACPRPLVDHSGSAQLLSEAGDNDSVQLLGVWCEGEGRTGKPLEGIERVFWHQWPVWWQKWNAERGTVDLRSSRPRLVSIRSPDAELARALVATLESASIAAYWDRETVASSPDLVLWDGAQLGGREADDLARISATARANQTEVVALLDFPRPETVAAAEALGARAVLGKPCDRDGLLETLLKTLAREKGEKPASSDPLPQGAGSDLDEGIADSLSDLAA